MVVVGRRSSLEGVCASDPAESGTNMSAESRSRSRGGFALVLTLSLLALLMLALVALSAVVKVNGEIAMVTAAQTRARQNALLGLSMGSADLQRHAGQDDLITGMAGITGIAAQGSSTTRNWCGVWRSDGSFVSWLTSGAQSNTTTLFNPGVSPIVLVGNGVGGGAGSWMSMQVCRPGTMSVIGWHPTPSVRCPFTAPSWASSCSNTVLGE